MSARRSSVQEAPADSVPLVAAGRRRDDRLVPWLVAAAAGAAYLALAWIGWRDIATPSWDLGIFTQLARAYSELGAPIVDIKGNGFNLLGDHFHPALVILGPLYRLHPSGWTLLALQAVLLALSAVPVTSVARERLGRAPGTVLGVAYAFSWGLQGAVQSQFHEIALAVPLLAMSLAAFLRDRPLAAALWAAPLVFVKEDLGLTVAALGAVLLWRAIPPRTDAGATATATRTGADVPPLVSGGADEASVRSDDPAPETEAEPAAGADIPPLVEESFSDRVRGGLASRAGWIGAWLAVWGVAWVFLAVVVILPLLNPGGTYDYVERIGEQHTDWFSTAVTILWPPVKLVTLLLLALAAGVLGVRSPLMWLLLPTLAWRFVGNVPYYWGWEWHYSAILMPVVVAALIDVVGRRRAHALPGLSPTPSPSAVAAAMPAPAPAPAPAAAAAAAAAAAPDAHARLRSDAYRWIAVGAAVSSSLVLGPTLPLVSTFGDGWPEPSPRIEAAHGAVAAASAVQPRSGEEPVVVGDIYLLAHLVPTTRVHWLGNDNPVPDAVVLDTWRRDADDQDAEVVAERTFPGWDFEIVYDEDGYVVVGLVGTRG